MDRLTQKERAGRNLINGRYMLKECLFANDLGTLYKARDTRPGVAGTSVLIHFLPNRSVAYNELPGLFPVLQGYAETLNCPVLKVVDYGWSGTVAYFIMLAPESWSVNVLPGFQEPPSNLHQSAIRITRDLLHKRIISTGLTSQAFLVMPGGLYLLPTALTEYFQVLQGREALLPLKEPSGKSGRLMFFLGWGAAVGFAAAGSGYIYHLYQQDEIPRNAFLQEPSVGKSESQIATEKTVMPAKTDNVLLMTESVSASFESSQLDRPEAGSATLFASVKQEALPATPQQETTPQGLSTAQEDLIVEQGDADEVKKEVAVASPKHEKPLINSGEADEPGQKESEIRESAHEPLLHKKMIVMNSNIKPDSSSPEVAQKTRGWGLKSKPVSPNVQASNATTVKPITQSQQRPLVIHSQPVKASPVPIEPAPVAPEIPKAEPARLAAIEPASLAAKIKKSSQKSPRLTANGLTSEQLIESAYKAIWAGQLGEVADRGAIYYIRLVKRIDRGNPQINRMARQVVSTYHTKARDAIRNKHENAARQLLWMAGRIIKEFNLTKMNKSHAMLKHRLGG